MRTFAPAMDVHAGEPVVPNKTPLCAVRNVSLLAVNVSLCKAKVDHVYRFLSWLEANDEISQLDVPVQYAARVHKLQPRNLDG
jgi:hypothetical protein